MTRSWKRATVLGVAVGLLALLAVAPGRWSLAGTARAATCDTSWQAVGGDANGSWDDGTHWTGGIPTVSSNACIKLSGSYTVRITGIAAVANSLTIGAGSGHQALTLGATCGGPATLSAPTITVGASAEIVLGRVGCANYGSYVTGTISNAGTIAAQDNPVGDFLRGDVTNTGTIEALESLSFDQGGSLVNRGTVTVDDVKALALTAASFTNDVGGSITTAGSGVVSLSGGSFTSGDGTMSGSRPVVLSGTNLTYDGTGAGSSKIFFEGSGALSGNLTATDSLTIEAVCNLDGIATAAGGFTNGGTITLVRHACATSTSRLVVPSGTLANQGTIAAEDNPVGDYLRGNVTNTGTIIADETLNYDQAGSSLLNQGSVTVADTKALALSNGTSFTNPTGGSISTAGSGVVSLSGGSFTSGDGTMSGSRPVVLSGTNLTYNGTGAGSSSIFFEGSGLLSGNLKSTDGLTVEAVCNLDGIATAASGFTNAGTITLASYACLNANNVLVVASGTLLNQGTIAAEPSTGDYLRGNVTNTGTIAADVTLNFDQAGRKLLNRGSVTVANGAALALSNASFTNDVGGSITATGTGQVSLSGGSFTSGNGTMSGSRPVVLSGSSVKFDGTGAGSSSIFFEGAGALSGNLKATDSLTIEAVCSLDAVATAAGGFTNAGTITLGWHSCLNSGSRLVISSGTLANRGTIVTQSTAGGEYLRGNVTNTGTIAADDTLTFDQAGKTLLNRGSVTVANGEALDVSGASFTNDTGGSVAATGTGVVHVGSGSTLTEGAGTTSGARPVVVDDGSLSYTGKGKSAIALRGSTALAGNIAAGQTLTLENGCGHSAVATAAGSFTNAGTIVLTSIGCVGDSDVIALAGGAGTLTNTGTLQVGPSGTRQIQGNLVNSKKLSIADGITLSVTGAYTQSGSGSSFITGSPTGTSFGLLGVGGTASLEGGLTVEHDPSFDPSLGSSFPIVGAGAVAGTFAKVTGAILHGKTAIYFAPSYGATSVSLVVRQATLSAPASAARGSSISVTGAGWVAGDKVTITFKDKAGATTTYPLVTADGSGGFSPGVTIPAGAAVGKGTIKAVSGITGVTLTRSISIT